MRVDSWCLCLHLRSRGFGEAKKIASGRGAELPLSKAFSPPFGAFIRGPRRSGTSQGFLSSQTQKEREIERGL